MFRLPRLVLALALIAISLSIASPAFADERSCEGTSFAQGGYELFTPELRYVPPPLRAVAWDCASRVADRPFGFDTGSSVQYLLVYTDIDFDVVVTIARSFEQQGWLEGYAAVTSIDTGGGMQNSVRYSADELAALDSPPLFAGGRFGNAATGHDIISLTYADGVNYFPNSSAFTTPNLVISVILTEQFSDTGLADPSVLSGLKSISNVHVTAAGATVMGGAAVMLTLVIGYPGSLLNSAVGPLYDRTREALRGRGSARTKSPAKEGSRSGLLNWLFIAGLVVASVISGFVDPSFGVNAMSVRVLVTAFLSLMIFNVAAWSLVRKVMRTRYPGSDSTVKFRWGSLVLVAFAVLISRMLDFNPGVIFGLVAGLVFATTLSKGKDAVVVLLGAGFGLLVALVAWVGFSLIAPLAAGAGDNVFLVFVSEFFSAVTIEGIASLPLALLPLLALDGHKLFVHKKWWWAVSYAIGLLAFMLVLLTIPGAWGEIPGDFLRWLLLFGGFAVVAIAVWVVFVVFERRRAVTTKPRAPG